MPSEDDRSALSEDDGEPSTRDGLPPGDHARPVHALAEPSDGDHPARRPGLTYLQARYWDALFRTED